MQLTSPSELSQDRRDEYEERAAHFEFDAGMTRQDAEEAAWVEIVK